MKIAAILKLGAGIALTPFDKWPHEVFKSTLQNYSLKNNLNSILKWWINKMNYPIPPALSQRLQAATPLELSRGIIRKMMFLN